MHFPERRQDQTEERILPLINVVFLLLIFFMIAGTLTQTEPLEVSPPVSHSEGEHDADLLIILMAADGRFALNNQLIEKPKLLSELAKKIAKQKQLQVNLKVDGKLPANQLVKFTQELNQQGLTKLKLVTEQDL